MQTRTAYALILFVLVIAAFPTHSQPLSPSDSLRKIRVTPGFKVELAAAEPLVLDPVAIDWDAAGRLWVVEMADYPLGMDGKGKPGGRIRVLEDVNEDGVYDRATLFAEDLNFPTGLITWRDGVIITAAPEIIFLKDSNGDGRADTRQVLFSGFLEGNQQLRINGLRWGLDNWIYCAVGGHVRGYGANTKIKSHLTGAEIALGSRDFRFRPDTGDFDPQSGPAQFGRDRDDWGHWFGSQNSNPLWHYVLADQYLRRNPHVAAPNPTQQIMVPVNPPIFPVSSPEKRFHSFEHKDHFTSGCSGMIYRDNLLFPAGEMHAFACEPFHNLVHHQILSDDGVTFHARRTSAEQSREFFASEDSWTRPVMVRTGPDGALWVVDMYRQIIEHPDWLPPEGREELLPLYRKGDDKGRIYRVIPNRGRRRKMPRLDRSSPRDLVQRLSSSNGWERDKAQQLLLWRKDGTNAISALKRLVQSPPAPLAQLHALWALENLDALETSLLEPAFTDENAGLRENALRLARQSLTVLTNEPSPKVRLQLACSLGEIKSSQAGEILAQIAIRDYDSPFIAAAVTSSAIPHLETLVNRLLETAGEPLSQFLEPLFLTALGENRRDLLQRLLHSVFEQNQFAAYSKFLQLLNRRQSSAQDLIKAAPDDPLSQELRRAPQLFAAAKTVTGADSNRFSALILLTRDPASRAEAIEALAAWITPTMPLQTQREAITAIVETAEPRAPEALLRNWSKLGPESRAPILEALLRREPWCFDLLSQIEVGWVSASAIDTARANRLLKHDSERVRKLAARVLTKTTNPNRAKVIEEFRPSLQLTGVAASGRDLYLKLCAACHRRDGAGNEVGPDLRSVLNHPAEKLLVNILDPNADVQPGYNAYACALTSGEELYGLISSETATSLLFKFPDGSSRTIARSEIRALASSALSLMPEGLESGLTKQDLADLIAFLKTP